MHDKHSVFLSLTSAFAVICALAVAGCDITTPSQLRTGNIRLQQDVTTVTLAADDVDENRMRLLADDYRMTARGPMSVTIAYKQTDALDKTVQQGRGEKIKRLLAANGLRDVSVDYVGVDDSALQGRTVITYKALQAKPPEDCTRMTGYQGAETLDALEKYQMGCESKTAMGRMIADPNDLSGVAGDLGATSRSAGTLLETYQSGKPAERFYPLSTASTVK